MKLSKNVLNFINHVKSECKRLGVKFRFSRYNDVHSGDYLYCCGFFDSTTKTLAVATKNRTREQWLSILVHEYCHFNQWRNSSKYWTKDSDQFLEWLQGKHKNWSKKTAYQKYIKARDVEWDCDNEAVKLIKKWKLPIDIAEYIRQANVYIASYAVMLKRRQWIVKSPCNFNKIMKLVPSNRILSRKDLAHPSQKFVDLCNKYCF